MSPQSWTRLIRFLDDNGNETFGEPVVTNENGLNDLVSRDDLYAIEYKGQSPVSQLTKGDKVHVKKVLELLRPSDVPIVKCIGLNYIKHSTCALPAPYNVHRGPRLIGGQSRKGAVTRLLTLPCSSSLQLLSLATMKTSLSRRSRRMGLWITRASW